MEILFKALGSPQDNKARIRYALELLCKFAVDANEEGFLLHEIQRIVGSKFEQQAQATVNVATIFASLPKATELKASAAWLMQMQIPPEITHSLSGMVSGMTRPKK